METVLYVTDLHVGSHVPQLTGLFERARAHRWRVIEIEMDRTTRPLADLVRQWRPAGCVVELGHAVRSGLVRVFRRLPTVFLDPDPETAKTARFTVANDPGACARLAVRELARPGPASYAFVGWCEPVSWSTGRDAAFAAAVESATGKATRAYPDGWPLGDPLAFQRRLAPFLRSLEKPCGLFAANDYTAVQVAEACQTCGIGVPGEIAIVGVDNETAHCENAATSLTSIEQDFTGAGRMAADLLARLLDNPNLPPEHLSYGPVRLVRRQSSRVLGIADPRIARAVERIRRDAVLGISAADVLAEIPVSRRLAEKRFRAATGHTVLEEIQEARLQKVFELLRTDMPIGQIAGMCGLRSDSYLKRLFKARTGLTLRAWRTARRAGDAPLIRSGAR